jgi:hypothetical protein
LVTHNRPVFTADVAASSTFASAHFGTVILHPIHGALRRSEQRCEAERCETSRSRASAASARIGAPFPQCQAVRIVIR